MSKFTISNHWVDNIDKVPTKKYSHGGVIRPRFIVMHYTCGWTTEGDIETLARGSGQVSAHLVLSRPGEFTQLVGFNRRAWHAGPSQYGKYQDINDLSVGIEISNIGWLRKRPDGRYEDYYGNVINPDGSFVSSSRNAASAPKDWLQTKNYTRLKPGVYVWEPYYEAQLEGLDHMTAALVKAYPSIEGVLTHEEIDKRGWKTDPGPAFPRDRYQKIVDNEGVLPGDEPVLPPLPPEPEPKPLVIIDMKPWSETKPEPKPIVEVKPPEPKPAPAPTPDVVPAKKKEGWGSSVKKWMRWPL
jgi:N-acetylmuramoyl-L-alanine amidase